MDERRRGEAGGGRERIAVPVSNCPLSEEKMAAAAAGYRVPNRNVVPPFLVTRSRTDGLARGLSRLGEEREKRENREAVRGERNKLDGRKEEDLIEGAGCRTRRKNSSRERGNRKRERHVRSATTTAPPPPPLPLPLPPPPPSSPTAATATATTISVDVVAGSGESVRFRRRDAATSGKREKERWNDRANRRMQLRESVAESW